VRQSFLQLQVFLVTVTALLLLGRVDADRIYNNLGMIVLSRGLIRSQNSPSTIAMQLSALNQAQTFFGEAVSHAPGHAQFVRNLSTVHLRRGDLYGEVEDWDRAIESYRAALDVDETSAEAYRKIGEIYVYHKPHEPQYLDQAIQYLEKAVVLSPSFGYQRIALGHALRFRGRTLEAIDQLKASISLSPNGFNWTVLGGFYVAEEDWESAIVCYKNALAFDPDRVDTWFGLGIAYAGKGERAEAISAWRKAIQLAPGSEVARAAGLKITELGK
jgi:tetratricopeptide (TPR) repeat protein